MTKQITCVLQIRKSVILISQNARHALITLASPTRSIETTKILQTTISEKAKKVRIGTEMYCHMLHLAPQNSLKIRGKTKR